MHQHTSLGDSEKWPFELSLRYMLIAYLRGVSCLSVVMVGQALGSLFRSYNSAIFVKFSHTGDADLGHLLSCHAPRLLSVRACIDDSWQGMAPMSRYPGRARRSSTCDCPPTSAPSAPLALLGVWHPSCAEKRPTSRTLAMAGASSASHAAECAANAQLTAVACRQCSPDAGPS